MFVRGALFRPLQFHTFPKQHVISEIVLSLKNLSTTYVSVILYRRLCDTLHVTDGQVSCRRDSIIQT